MQAQEEIFFRHIMYSIALLLDYSDLLKLRSVSKKFKDQVNTLLLHQETMQKLIQKDIQISFNTSDRFDDFLKNQPEIYFPSFLKAVRIIGGNNELHYDDATSTLMPYYDKSSEVKYLLTQLHRKYPVAVPVLSLFSNAEKFYHANPNSTNALTLMHYYYLLAKQNIKAPVVLDKSQLKDHSDRVKHIYQATMDNPPKRNEEEEITTHILTLFQGELVSLLQEVSEIINIEGFRKLAPLQQLQYAVMFWLEGGSRLLKQLQTYQIEDCFRLTPVQVKCLQELDLEWIFSIYEGAALKEIKALMDTKVPISMVKELSELFSNQKFRDFLTTNEISLVKAASLINIINDDELSANKKILKLLVDKKKQGSLKGISKESQIEAFKLLLEWGMSESLAMDLVWALDTPEKAKTLISKLEQFPALSLKLASSRPYILIFEQPEAVLAKVSEILEKLRQKGEIATHAFMFIVDLVVGTKELSNQDECIAMVLGKFRTTADIKGLYANNGKTHLYELLTTEANRPWAKMLSYEQLRSMDIRVLLKIKELPDTCQRVLLLHLRNKYKDNKFKPGMKEVTDFVAVWESHHKKTEEMNKAEQMEVEFEDVSIKDQAMEESSYDNDLATFVESATMQIQREERLEAAENEIAKKDKLIANLKRQVSVLKASVEDNSASSPESKKVKIAYSPFPGIKNSTKFMLVTSAAKNQDRDQKQEEDLEDKLDNQQDSEGEFDYRDSDEDFTP